jgi:hypothetical protein
MLKLFFFTSLVFITGSIQSEARPFRNQQIAECNVSMPCDFSYRQADLSTVRGGGWLQMRQRGTSSKVAMNAFASASEPEGRVIGGRPAGCPSSYCGCGAALRVFGRVIPELNLAANWLRFPRTSPAPGMVAARRGHVFVLEQHVGGDMWMAYDSNSGGHATRVHARLLRGYTVVNPHAT